jgi:GMP synthase-like glutamine amidotransferase
MKLHYLQHEIFEDPAVILAWSKAKRWRVSRTMLFKEQVFPDPSSIDWLVIMGGSMGVYDEKRHPWLVAEKEFIGEVIERGKKVIGVCLGAQLVSHVLGGMVCRNEHEEIGWFPVTLTEEGRTAEFFAGFPDTFSAFHWHADTFTIPQTAARLAASEACRNQAFAYDGGRVVGLQFHLEVDRPGVAKMAKILAKKPRAGKYIQSPGDIIASAPEERYASLKSMLFGMLDAMDRLA